MAAEKDKGGVNDELRKKEGADNDKSARGGGGRYRNTARQSAQEFSTNCNIYYFIIEIKNVDFL